MKKLLLAALVLTGCSTAPTEKPAAAVPAEDPIHAAVTAHLKKTLDDPASYQSARWGKPETWEQQDANALRADSLQSRVDLSMHYLKLENARTGRLAHLQLTRAQKKNFDKGFNDAAGDVKYFQNLQDSLLKTKDATQLGTIVSHAYRAKNKMGALVLDSARFLIYKNGSVQKI